MTNPPDPLAPLRTWKPELAPEPEPERAWRVSWRWLPVSIVATAAVTALVTSVGFGAFGSGPTPTSTGGGGTFTLTGGITVHGSDGDIREDGSDNCVGDGGYSDMNAGTAVTVQDSHGAIVATGALAAGTFANPDANEDCVFPFTVSGVPDGLSQYGVTVSHRGTQIVSASEAHSGVELTLGG